MPNTIKIGLMKFGFCEQTLKSIHNQQSYTNITNLDLSKLNIKEKTKNKINCFKSFSHNIIIYSVKMAIHFLQ